MAAIHCRVMGSPSIADPAWIADIAPQPLLQCCFSLGLCEQIDRVPDDVLEEHVRACPLIVRCVHIGL